MKTTTFKRTRTSKSGKKVTEMVKRSSKGLSKKSSAKAIKHPSQMTDEELGNSYVYHRFHLEKTGKYASRVREMDAITKELNTRRKKTGGEQVSKLRRKNV